jgi:hypothetical protein
MHQHRSHDASHELHASCAQRSRRNVCLHKQRGYHHIDVNYAESVGSPSKPSPTRFSTSGRSRRDWIGLGCRASGPQLKASATQSCVAPLPTCDAILGTIERMRASDGAGRKTLHISLFHVQPSLNREPSRRTNRAEPVRTGVSGPRCGTLRHRSADLSVHGSRSPNDLRAASCGSLTSARRQCGLSRGRAAGKGSASGISVRPRQWPYDRLDRPRR